jgi:RNA polymerase sigma-70 factor (ECF subfamily)
MTAAGGAEISVERAYREHGRTLQAILYARCCDRELADEAVQEAFLRLHQHRRDAIQGVLAWLVQVGRNWLTDEQRRRQRRRAEEIAPGSEPADRVPRFDALETLELRDQVRQGLERLDENDRLVLVMKYALGWESARIADSLEINAAAVDMRLSRARRRLAEVLSQMGVMS